MKDYTLKLNSQTMKYRNHFFVLAILISFCFQLSAQSLSQSIAEVKTSTGVPTLYIDGKAIPPYAYMSYLGEEKYYKEVAEAGIHLYNFPAYLGDRGINSGSGIGPFRDPIWIGENEYDFSGFKMDFDKILNADPQAKVIIRLHLDPPVWWEKRNPGTACQLPDGTTFRNSFFSETWKKESGIVLKACIKWLQNSPYSQHLVGIHVAGGSTEEWFYHFKQFFYDENPARLQAFRQWLKNNYNGNTLSLQKSWNNNSVDFNTAQLSDISGKERRREWRNPDKEQDVIDTYKFHCETMADNIAYFCKIVKETSNGHLLTGAFYGYQYYVTDPRRGHGALAKLLDCPDLDYLSSPNVYNRVIGEDWPPMAAIESIKLHGKLWLVENDTRTSITTLLKDRKPEACPPGQYQTGVWLGPEDMETSVSFLWKNLGRMLTNGYGGWWFDMWGGWFSDPDLLFVLEKAQQYHELYPPVEENKMRAQVCVFIDEELCFWDASLGSLTNNILENRYPLSKTGAPYDLYLRTDLNTVSANPYRVIWLMGALELNMNEKQKIKEWQQKGITVMWTDGKGTKIYSPSEKPTSFNKKFKFSDSQLRELWKAAGVHVYTETDDVFYIGRNWMCIHTVIGGKRTIRFPFYTQVIDPLQQKAITDSTKLLEINLKPKSTTLFRINPL
jgi:beta-galactosidase